MQYTLINRKGQVRQFYVLAVAELYQTIEGGVVFSQQIFEQKEVDTINPSQYNIHMFNAQEGTQ